MITRTYPILAILSLFALAACETVQGAGRDIQSAGAAVSDTAEETQENLQ